MSVAVESMENTTAAPQQEGPKAYQTFDEMGIPDTILRGIYSHGFERPTPIQSIGIVPIKEGHDILAQARSGTGKTGTFTIGSLCRIDPAVKKTQVLVIVPTHELALQIANVAAPLSNFMGISVYAAMGKTPLRNDIKAIEKGAQFLVGTPGRIYDLMNRGTLVRDQVRVLILDEADQMLEDRFKEQVMYILEMGFPKETQVALFSATMPEDVIEVADNLLRNPVRILLPPEKVKLEGIVQFYVPLEKEDWKYDVLCDLYQQLNINQAIIYTNKRQKAEWLAEKMSAQGFPLSFIHGEMEVEERRRRMADFRKGAVRVLIATDLLARGIDVQQVNLVINYELPPNLENYVHRIGRAGRHGRKGVTINLIAPEDETQLENIRKMYAMDIQALPNDLARLPL
jgi:translation initiation factor 4A